MHPEGQRDHIKKREQQIEEGLKEGVQAEIERLERLGIPYYVGENGTIVRVDPPPKPAEAAEH